MYAYHHNFKLCSVNPVDGKRNAVKGNRSLGRNEWCQMISTSKKQIAITYLFYACACLSINIPDTIWPPSSSPKANALSRLIFIAFFPVCRRHIYGFIRCINHKLIFAGLVRQIPLHAIDAPTVISVQSHGVSICSWHHHPVSFCAAINPELI